jgi:hypothetical protein
MTNFFLSIYATLFEDLEPVKVLSIVRFIPFVALSWFDTDKAPGTLS